MLHNLNTMTQPTPTPTDANSFADLDKFNNHDLADLIIAFKETLKYRKARGIFSVNPPNKQTENYPQLPPKPDHLANPLPSTSSDNFSVVSGPKRFKKNPLPRPTDETPVNNRFTALMEHDSVPDTPETLAATATPATTAPTDHKKQPVPPFVLRYKQNWTQVSRYLKTQNIPYTKATNAKDGINVYTANEQQYRTMQKALVTLKTPFHTYQLRSEKSLRVVIRGVIQHISTDEIQQDLHTQGYECIKVTRLNGKDNRPAPLIMVELDKKFKSIYNLIECCGLTVTVESKRTLTGQKQCHKCQLYGHTQPNCHAEYRCMKCAEAHSTHECPKPKTIPARCANCNGEHPSNYSGCPQNPNRPILRSQPPTQPQPRAQHFSYSSAVKGASNPQPAAPSSPKNSSTFSSILGEMLISLYALNPSQQQVLEFVNNTNTLYKLYTQQK